MARPWSWQLLRAGSFKLDGGGMFGVVPKVLWSKLAQPDHLNRILLQTNCLLLQDGQTRVLIETGFGDKWTEKERGLYDLQPRTVVDALREIGCEPSDISHVLVTHLHFDHAAALTRMSAGGEIVPTFPNAEIVVQATEWSDALANKSTMTRTYLRSHLDPVADRVRLIDGAAEALPGIFVEPAPGHTWGQQLIRFEDRHGVVCFPGDVMPTVNHVGLAFSIGYDMLPHQNMLTKQAILARAAPASWRIVLDHEPGPAVVRAQPDPSRAGQFTLQPEDALRS
jgi:glyoxylase-like metal-dependent hydrolase (beta-lactamase superfamily II)